MYKVMLAEDEPGVLDAIISTIDWASFSFEPPVGCCDGREAIRKLESGFSPDVLITDICMPFVDGLELTKYISERFPKAIVVVLSGYDEFAYAQKALQMQVYDYILKPVTPNRIKELLGRLGEELTNRRLNSLEDSLSVLQRHFLHRILERRPESPVVEENCRRHRISFSPQSLVMVLDADSVASNPDDPENALSFEMLRYALSNIAGELAEEVGALAYQAQAGETRIIIGGENENVCRENAKELADRILSAIGMHLSGSASAGIGEPVESPERLYISYRQAAEARSYRFFRGENSVLFYHDIRSHENAPTKEIDVADCYRGFESAIMRYDRQAASEEISRLFQRLAMYRCMLDRCVFCCQRLIMILYQFADKFGDGQEGKTLEKMWIQLRPHEAATIAALEDKMQELCAGVLEQFDPVHTDSASAQVAKAESYIHEHFGDPGLSLQTITEHLAVSVSYFSSVFKLRTRMTFVEYLTKVRMDKAKQLLFLSDSRSYEIAEQVGFSDPHYFSVAFKRYTGMSPREFREFGRKQDKAQPGQ